MGTSEADEKFYKAATDGIDKIVALCAYPNRACPYMKETHSDFHGERYRCEMCGKSNYLDYDDMR